jgi:hypothetical protein
LQPSPFPRYDSPLTIEGDCLVLNDLEVPFHAAEFVNRCLDLCDAWGIKQLILGGDFLHFEVLSAWGAAWQQEAGQIDSISEATESEMRAAIQALPPEHQGVLLEQLQRLADNRQTDNDEIKAGAKALKILAQVFEQIYCVIGNHDDRLLRKLQAPMTPQTLLNFMGLTEKCWLIKPYYFCNLTSGGELWRIEHQRAAGINVAIRQADIHDCNVICAHNHLQAFNWSTNGKHYAISSGCCVDEKRLAYAAQRDSNSPAHKIGAVIIRGSTPYLLHERSPWDCYRRM